jgi:nucleoid DNA-binding protein
MKKPEIVQKMARRSGTTPGKAADQLDLMVREILDSVRHGKETLLPGLGRFVPGIDGKVAFEKEKHKRRG